MSIPYRRLVMFYPNRVACDVLDEMRKMDETKNYASLKGNVEELQGMFNRMESALEDKKDIKQMNIRRKELKREIEKLEKKVWKKQQKLEDLEDA